MKKKSAPTKQKRLSPFDFSSWNFIIFLTLAFILIVTVALAISGQAQNLSAQAGISCPRVRELPRPEGCPGGKWVYGRDSRGCARFECPQPSPTVAPTPSDTADPGVTRMPLPTRRPPVTTPRANPQM